MSKLVKENAAPILSAVVSILLGVIAWGWQAGQTAQQFRDLLSRVESIEKTGTPYGKETRWTVDSQAAKLTQVENRADRMNDQMTGVIGDVREIKVAVARIEKALEKMSDKK